MVKKELTLDDLQAQYEAFCENVKSVKQNTYWRTAFHYDYKDKNNAETEK